MTHISLRVSIVYIDSHFHKECLYGYHSFILYKDVYMIQWNFGLTNDLKNPNIYSG